MIYALLALSLMGLILNLAFADVLLQPDWALALLLGALLAHRGYWPWVLGGIMVHDMVLHWSPWVCLPWVALAPLLLIWSDAQAGPSLVQRFVIMGLVIAPMLLWYWSWPALMLTALFTTIVWYQVSKQHAQPA